MQLAYSFSIIIPFSVSMSARAKDSATAASPQAEIRTKLEKGTEDWNLFHSLVDTVPDFLDTTASKLKKKYPQFQSYSTSIPNTCIQNARKQQKKKKESEKKTNNKDSGKGKDELTVEERSKSMSRFWILLVCCRVFFRRSHPVFFSLK